MFGSNILEIAIGLIFVFILVSTICSSVREGIESFLKTRAAYLEQGIRQLLNDPSKKNPPPEGAEQKKGIVEELYSHPLIDGLFQGVYKAPKFAAKIGLMDKGNNLPSYIPSKNFAAAILDIAAKGAISPNTDISSAPLVSLGSIREGVAKMENPKLQRALLYAIDSAQGDINKAQANVEAWYNSGMDRVSGWYKRSTQWIIFWIALVITVGLNINTITIVNYLAKNETQLKVIVDQAAAMAKDSSATKDYSTAEAKLQELKLPIGWSNCVQSVYVDAKKDFGVWNSIFGPLFGLLITALAATLGAPFWFDMLNKVMVVRSTVKPHQKSGEEGSQDKPGNKAQPQAITINTVAAPAPAAPVPHAENDEMDCCGTKVTDPITADEDLPETKGGIE